MNTPITGEFARSDCIQDGHPGPFFPVLVTLVDLWIRYRGYFVLAADVGLEIGANEIPIIIVSE